MPYPPMKHTYSGQYDIFFPVEPPYAECHVKHDGEKDSGVRAYISSPESMCLQLRTYSSVNGRFGKHAGASTPVWSAVSLDKTGLSRLIKGLQEIRDGMQGNETPGLVKPHTFSRSARDADLCGKPGCGHYSSNRKVHPEVGK